MQESADPALSSARLTTAATLTEDFAPNLALPWVMRLRYGIACGEAAIAVGMTLAFHFSVAFPWAIAVLSVVVGSNLWLARKPKMSIRFPQQTLGAIFVLDTLCLTAILALTGGPTNPLAFSTWCKSRSPQ